MQQRYMRLWLLLLAPLWAGGAAAQQEDNPNAGRVYDIELIVFEYVGGVRGSREDWRYIDKGRDAVQTEMDAAQAFIDERTTDAPNEARQPVGVDFERLARSQLRLSEQYQRMRNSRDYRPIAHGAWRQPVYGQAERTTLRLGSVINTPAALGGHATLHVNRFLHLELDLALLKNSADESGTDSTRYLIHESRKMRSSELHFFDHPRYGVLAYITRAADASDAD